MKNYPTLLLLIVICFTNISCFEDQDDIQNGSSINDFVWKGMNLLYLYKDNVPNLANDAFLNPTDYNNFLNGYSNPRDLFESLIYQRESVDKYSRIFEDYIALEQQLSGVTISNGMEFKLFLQPNSNSQLIGIVTMVLPNSSANANGLKRGDIFNGINGTPLTTSNYSSLLGLNTYSLNLANYNDNDTDTLADDVIESRNESITLTKAPYTENPIFKTAIFNRGGQNVGYLMYNSFTASFDEQLNNAFATFKSNNVQQLVLDLRYNSGGSVNSALLLSSMITGQFNGEIFLTEHWNNDMQSVLEDKDPESLITRFVNNNRGTPLNSLNLQKVYIIALKTSASASELVINSLDPYIEVIHIGENTTGKFQASTLVYDSPDFSRQGANPSHSYAMLPLIFKSANKVGRTDYFDGLTPDIPLSENHLNLGVLGDENEPLLATALAEIQSPIAKPSTKPKKEISLKLFETSRSFKPFFDEMYVDKKLPSDVLNNFLVE